MSHNAVVLVVAAFVYVATFPLAWKLVAELVAMAAAGGRVRAKFWWKLLVYQAVIIAPYAVLLAFGNNLSSFVTNLLIGLIGISVVLTAFRFIGGKRTVAGLWWLYGFVYDGLRYFYPYQNLINLVARRVEAGPNQTILDLGCGTGNVSVLLAQALPKASITAMDATPTMLKRARRKLSRVPNPERITIQLADILTFLRTVPDASYDHVVMSNVIYAVTDHQTLWRESLRVLKPGGQITATNSDRAGSRAIIAEHLAHKPWYSLLRPSLMAVGLIDYFISQLSATQVFQFVTRDQLEADIAAAGGAASNFERCYGGQAAGVNLLFTVTHRS